MVTSAEKPGRSLPCKGMARIEHDLYRDSLHHLGEVSGRVVRRQKSEL